MARITRVEASDLQPEYPMKDTSNTGGGETAAPREDRDSVSRNRAKTPSKGTDAGKSSASGFGEGLDGKASSPKKATKKTTRRRPKAKSESSDSASPSASSDGKADNDQGESKQDRRRNRSSASVKAAKAKTSESSDAGDAGQKPKRPRRPRKKGAPAQTIELGRNILRRQAPDTWFI